METHFRQSEEKKKDPISHNDKPQNNDLVSQNNDLVS